MTLRAQGVPACAFLVDDEVSSMHEALAVQTSPRYKKRAKINTNLTETRWM